MRAASGSPRARRATRSPRGRRVRRRGARTARRSRSRTRAPRRPGRAAGRARGRAPRPCARAARADATGSRRRRRAASRARRASRSPRRAPTSRGRRATSSRRVAPGRAAGASRARRRRAADCRRSRSRSPIIAGRATRDNAKRAPAFADRADRRRGDLVARDAHGCRRAAVFVLETTGSPGRMSLVLAAQAAPLALLALASGRVATRLGARRTMLCCDALWALATAAIPVLHWAGALSFAGLVALAFVTGIPAGAHFGSQSAIVAELLGEDAAGVARANALLRTASRVTYFAGPAIGGALLAVVGASAVMLADAATFAVSFVLVLLLVPETAARGTTAARLGDGLVLLRRDPVLRPLVAAQFASQAAFMAMNAAIPVLVFTRYGRDPALAGLLLGVWGGGAVAGGIAAFRFAEGRDPLRLGALAWAVQAAPRWLLVAAPPAALAAGALFLSGVGNGLRVPPMLAAMTARIPPPVRAGTMTVS